LVLGLLWGPWPVLIFFVWQLLSSSCRATSLTWGRVSNLQCNDSLVSLGIHNQILLPHLRLPQPGEPSPFTYIPHEQGQSHVTSDSQSASQYILMSRPRLRLH
jgi:hypothetical protein